MPYVSESDVKALFDHPTIYRPYSLKENLCNRWSKILKLSLNEYYRKRSLLSISIL